MLGEKDIDAAAASESLYRWWLDVIPAVFAGGTQDANATAPASANDASSQPFPIGQASQALTLAQQILRPLYQGLFQALLAQQPGQAFSALQELVRNRVAGMTDTLTGIGRNFPDQPGLAGLGSGFATTPLALFGEALKPLSLNLERAYGGVADAFGLASLREFQAAAREMAAAALAHRQAQAEYLGLVAGALGKGAEALTTRLAEMGQRGESVDSVLALVRLWARTTDEAMHSAMQSPQALAASAKLIRAATRSRRQQQRMVAIASEALNVPTRAELDDAYRAIQELKRELRRLRKSIAPAATALQADGVVAKRPASASARAPRPPAKRKNNRKVATA